MSRQKKVTKNTINIKDIIPNENNPRILSDKNLKRMKKSIKDFPRMMELRPIIIDENNTIVGGNMRYHAMIDMGYDEIPDNWVKMASKLTKKQKQEFIIKDNLNFGEWEYEGLKEFFKEDDLNNWEMDTGFFDLDGENQKDLSGDLQESYKVEIDLKNEDEQEKVYNELVEKGYTCRLLTL